MNVIKRFLLSRSTVLTLLLLIFAAVAIRYFVPQRFNLAEREYQQFLEDNSSLVPFVEFLGLDHIYTTPWFAVLIFLFLLSLILSTFDQVRSQIKQTFGELLFPEGKGISASVSEAEFQVIVRKKGYRRTGKNRFIKYPWGHWGNVLFHAGMVIVIASAFIMLLTEQRGLIHLGEGETFTPGQPWLAEENGIMAGEYVLPEPIRLDRFSAEFYASDRVRQLTSQLSFLDPMGRATRFSLAINETLDYRGLRFYQKQEFGSSFYLEFSGEGMRRNAMVFSLGYPFRRDMPLSKDFAMDDLPYIINLQYYTDAEKDSMSGNNPLLIMKLHEKGDSAEKGVELAEVMLTKGNKGTLGPYDVKFVGVAKWTGIIVTRNISLPGIFAGFSIIILGVCLIYFFPPREFIIQAEGGMMKISWRAVRFEELFIDEYEELKKQFGVKA